MCWRRLDLEEYCVVNCAHSLLDLSSNCFVNATCYRHVENLACPHGIRPRRGIRRSDKNTEDILAEGAASTISDGGCLHALKYSIGGVSSHDTLRGGIRLCVTR